jgi:NAD(P)-dependent dehydrogenase (short-subunit alcohol dehydrogenase family)
MGQHLKDKSAVVTGGGSGGIGKAVAFYLAAEGAKVVVNDIGRDPTGTSIADKTVDEIKQAGGIAVANYDSVTTMQGGETIIKTATSNFGKIDILVNCAANNIVVPINEISEQQWDATMNVHVKGHFSCTKAAVVEMMKQKFGRIINFSSRAAFSGRPPALGAGAAPGKGPPGAGGPGALASYSTAKAAILGFTVALSGGLKQYGITINCIMPSAVTKLFPGTKPKTTLPTSLWLEPDYIAPVVAYLATDQARDVTGQFIYASGGDLCIYALPLEIKGESNIFVRKMGKWTIDELTEVFPSILGLT